MCVFFFSSRRRHTRLQGDWSSDVCSSDLPSNGGRFRLVHRDTVALSFAENVASRNGCKGREGGKTSNPRSGLGALGGRCEIGRAACRERMELGGGRGQVHVRVRRGREKRC